MTVANENTDSVPLVLLRSVRLDLGLSILFVVGLLGQVRGHGGCLYHCFEAALSLLHVLLRVENDDIDLGYVEHAQGHGGAQAHGHCQGRGLDKHLEQRHSKSERCLFSQNSMSIHHCARNN